MVAVDGEDWQADVHIWVLIVHLTAGSCPVRHTHQPEHSSDQLMSCAFYTRVHRAP